MSEEADYIAFAGARRIAFGPLREVLPVLKERFDEDRSELLMVFEVDTGRQVDYDLRGSLGEVLERESQKLRRGPGRPKLGVISREVTLLPRHWDWLEAQSSGISGALRRLVERGMKVDPAKERARLIRSALSQFLSAMAGDRPNYEEASRALFRGDTGRFEALVERWPKDIRDHAVLLAREAARAETSHPQAPEGEGVIAELYRIVWTEGDYRAIERLVSNPYVIHSDPGDPWDKKTLDRETYEERVKYSRTAFPDLRFTVHEMVSADNRVAVRWSAEGTHAGDLKNLPATGKLVNFSGQTIYDLKDKKVAGHWQLVDRLGFVQQL